MCVEFIRVIHSRDNYTVFQKKVHPCDFHDNNVK